MNRAGSVLFSIFLLAIYLAIVPFQTAEADQNEHRLAEGIYKRLKSIHHLLADGDPAKALQALRPELSLVKGDSYASAVVYQTYGYVYISLEDDQRAVDAFEAALALSSLPDPVVRHILFDLVQLNFSLENYRKGIGYFEKWLAKTRHPSPDAHLLAARGYIALEDSQKAIFHLQQAIAGSASPKEAWYRSILAIYFQEEEYSKAVDVLKEMVLAFPDQSANWKQLADLYRMLEEDGKALAAQELAYKQGMLDADGLIKLVDLYLYEELPSKAGSVLEQGLKDGIILSSSAHWKWLSDIWVTAREGEQARSASKKGASLSEGENKDTVPVRKVSRKTRLE